VTAKRRLFQVKRLVATFFGLPEISNNVGRFQSDPHISSMPASDHNYSFKLPLARERDAHSLGRRSTARHFRYRAVPRANRIWPSLNIPSPSATSSTTALRVFGPWPLYSREEIVQAVHRLLFTEEAVVPGDKRPLFTCSECGDLGCAAVTFFLVRYGESTVGKDFELENNYEENIRREECKHIGPCTFNSKQYESALLETVDKLK
jgi:hypothetical protein